MSITLSLYKRKKPIPREKIERVKRLVELFRKYDKIIIADFNEVPANLIKRARLAIKDKGLPLVIKNKLALKALEQVEKEKPYLSKLKEYLTGMRMLVFTNEDPIEIAQEIHSFSEKIPPRPGKRVPFDIVVPKGGTGLRPGPVMTDLRVAGLPVRIIEGELFIMQDTVLVKKGERLSAQAVKVMQILDISPFEARINIIGVLDGKIFIPGELALKPLSEFEDMIINAISSARNVTINAGIPLPEVIEDILALAHLNALNIATEAGIIVPENAELLVSRAFNTGLMLLHEIAKEHGEKLPEDLKSLLETAAVAATAPTAPAEEEKKEEKKEEEEEAIVGLASLFG